MGRNISNTTDTIDSRDIIKRFEDLESERADLLEAVKDAQEALDGADEDDEDYEDYDEAVKDAQAALDDWDGADEYELLKALCEECEGYGDWSCGTTLINEDYFTEYAQELANDIHDMSESCSWPFNHIDWDAAAEELKQDYSEVDYDGQTFLIRD